MVHSGAEIIVGARKDNNFGPIIMCGLGGIYVEVMKDIAFRAARLNQQEIMKMITEIRSYPLLLGVRGENKKDIDSLIETIIIVESIIRKCRDITDIEINPVSVHDQGKGVQAVDVRILLSTVEETNE
jgi:acyl-CoA synthetase (NDP forming)